MHKAWYCLEAVPYCFSRSFVKFQGHSTKKIVDFDPNWAFPDCNSSLTWPVAMKWFTKLETAWERCPIDFQGHLSNFKVTQDKKLRILIRIERFLTLTPVWIDLWLLNDEQSLMQYRRGDLLFFKVICQISRSCGKRITDFDPNWAFLDCNSSLNSPIALKWYTKLNVV